MAHRNNDKISDMADFHIKALELAKQGNWDAAHDLVQDFNDEFSCLIHGYLHRVEGDEFNASYWYNRAGHTRVMNSQEEEFERLYVLITRDG